jgi:hypothetical protein
MSLNTTEIQIFVSCPGDVKAEKQVVKEVCDLVNNINIEIGCSVRLTFRDFSTIIGNTGIRPQQIINEQIVGYDIYLGILHMRFGTPTGGINPTTGKEFDSGTEEEFVIASGKKLRGEDPQHIYVFFKKHTGSDSFADNEQAGKVLRFKESIMPANWVNNFDDTHQFERKIFALLTTIAGKLCIEKLTDAKQAYLADGLSLTPLKDHAKIDTSHFVPDLPNLGYYIPRSITDTKKSDSLQDLFFHDQERVSLKDVLINQKRIALLGNAGSGKSTELQHATKYYLDSNTPFIPVYKRFNSYVDEKIEDFLPSGWDKITPALLVIFLDGLDEVQPQFFNTAVRKLIDFSEKCSDVRIVVSCRTNFYELPAEGFSGTLTGFSVYRLNDIALAEVRDYAVKNFKLKWEAFIHEVYKHQFLDILQKPFFLDILINYYSRYGNFEGGRTKIIENSIFSMIAVDKEHFKTSVETQKSKSAIIRLLQKVAFIMEVMGKNFISDDELQEILTNADEVEQIKRFSSFSKNLDKNVWMFEHNNIQEFLAAQVLVEQPFEKLVEVISFLPNHEKVKPTWVNTISFLISTGDPHLAKRIIDWLIANNHEIIVKFEPDRIDRNLRIDLFKRIFNFYKEKNIWLSSNNFTYDELSRFAESTESVDFLFKQIKDDQNSRIVKMNAISVLERFNLDALNPEYKPQAKKILENLLNDQPSDSYLVYRILFSLGDLGITDKNTIEFYVNKFSKNKNQYIRAGLYRLINKSQHLDEYIDVYIEGLNLGDIENATGEREEVNLMDESFHLDEGLKNVKSPAALRKILVLLKRSEERRRLNRYDHRDVIDAVLKNTFKANETDPKLYDDVVEIYITAGKHYDQPFAEIFLPFFKQISKEWETFQFIWKNEDIKQYDKHLLIELLLDKKIIDHFVDEYKNRNFTNEDAILLQQLLLRKFDPGTKDFLLLEEFEKKIKVVSNLELERPPFIDWGAINKRKAQESFDILFEKDSLIKEIERIFSEIGKSELAFDDLWELRRVNYRDIDDYFNSTALDLLREFTRDNRTVTYAEVEKWIKEDLRFDDYQLEQIHQFLSGGRNQLIDISKSQQEFIEARSKELSAETDIKSAINPLANGGFSVNRSTTLLWFFLRKFNIQLPIEKILDFTLFYNFEKQNEADRSSIIKELESFVEKDKIEARVSENITRGLSEDHVWLSNVVYAINNNLKKTYPDILRNITSSLISEHYRRDVLDLYFKKTNDRNSLLGLLNQILPGELAWKAVDLLISKGKDKDTLLQYLYVIVSNEYEPFDHRMRAAKYLMQLDDLRGLKFIADHILSAKDSTFDFHSRLHTISYLRNPEAIPILMELLKIGRSPEFQKDRFNSLESSVLDSLYNIGIVSEENFIIVKKAIDDFIEKNKDELPHLNFLHFNISKMEQQLYLKKSTSLTIKEAIKEFTDLASR